jgi:hypothetical protein
MLTKAARKPWLLLLLFPVGVAPLLAGIGVAADGAGVAIASLPILAVASFLLLGILACVFFLDEEPA